MGFAMGPEDIHAIVAGTGRLSAALFAGALVGAALAWHAVRLWLAFMAAHTIHFAAVAWFAVVNDGQNLFPGGRSLAEAGGWPALLAIAAFFYALALISLASMTRPFARRLRMAGVLTTGIIGFMFLAVYVPMLRIAAIFVLLAAAIVGALGFFLVREILSLRKAS